MFKEKGFRVLRFHQLGDDKFELCSLLKDAL
jgi:hypothetical protein